MAWVKFKRLRVSTKEPSIVLNSDRFSYNTIIAKLTEFNKNKFVVYRLDEEQRKIGFEFSAKNVSDAYPIQRVQNKGFRSSAGELVQRNLWIKKVAQLKNLEQRKFIAIEENKNVWVIQLIPAFEYKVKKSEKLSIAAEARGIYRYLDKDGNIVYIGKGIIRGRLSEPTRKDWNFETVEYSIIQSDADQLEWESYWIDKYKESNNGRLPYYNKVAGVQSP
ncbi:MAG: hypothetical protein HY088_05705 [Ignavibacteriales bacterium]|nr:hypothetical protein [Ignavibacteriales bacterium]